MLRLLSLALLAVSSEAGCTVKSLQCYVDTPQRILNPNAVSQGDITQECVGIRREFHIRRFEARLLSGRYRGGRDTDTTPHRARDTDIDTCACILASILH